MKIIEVKLPIYAENDNETLRLREAWVSFANRLRNQGCAVTADKTAEAIAMWEKNYIIKNEIIKHYKI